MEPQTKIGFSAKDFFLNLGAMAALYTLVVSLVNLLFTIINTIYPQVTGSYFTSQSISWPVAVLIIFSPIFILLMWFLERDYKVNPEKQSAGFHRWVTYVTLFLSGLAIAVDLITVIYYFIDGQELNAGFVLKVLVLLVIAGLVFTYYIQDLLGRLTARSRNIWRVVAGIVALASILWGFAVLGSPRTQRMYKYDDQKVSDLMSINNQINYYYSVKGALPVSLEDSIGTDNYFVLPIDEQNKKAYEYKKLSSTSYELCADFNKESSKNAELSQAKPYPYEGGSWVHQAGRFCFERDINPNLYSKPLPVR